MLKWLGYRKLFIIDLGVDLLRGLWVFLDLRDLIVGEEGFFLFEYFVLREFCRF